jgi:membrane protease YdiL (CAAX protease family)
VAAGFTARRTLAYPIRHQLTVAFLLILLLLWDIAAFAWVLFHPHDPAGLALHIVLLTVIAPVAEELFFRGWLWTALHETWGAT